MVRLLSSSTAVVDGAVQDRLLDDGGALTGPGRARFEAVSTELAALTVPLYGDLPAADLDTAGRVLALVTARSQAALSV